MPEGAFPVASSVVALPVESAVVPEVAPPVASPVVALPTNLKALKQAGCLSPPKVQASAAEDTFVQ